MWLTVLWMYGFSPVCIFSCFVKKWMPSKSLTTCITRVRFQFRITWGLVRSEYRIKALPHLPQFSSSLTFLKAKNFIYFTAFTTFVSFHCSIDFQIICKVIPCDCRLCHINSICAVLLQKPVLKIPSTTFRELENSGLLRCWAQRS